MSERFLRAWFRGPLDLANIAREVFACAGPMPECRRKLNVAVSEDGFVSVCEKFKRENVLLSAAFWEFCADKLEWPGVEEVRFDRIFFDFDSGDPKESLREALDFAERVEREWGATPVVAASGFKGAHVYVFLSEPVGWAEYSAAAKKLSAGCEHFDAQTINARVRARVPQTFNVKAAGRRLCRVLRPRDLDVRSLDLLDVRSFKVYAVELELPTVKRLRERRGRISWIDAVLERGLPDGRRRFILFVASKYLVNALGLSDEEAVEVLERFAERSERLPDFAGSGKIRRSELRAYVKSSRARGTGPPSLEKIAERDPQLYELVLRACNEYTAVRRSD